LSLTARSLSQITLLVLLAGPDLTSPGPRASFYSGPPTHDAHHALKAPHGGKFFLENALK